MAERGGKCAACKHRKKRCSPDCLLAPYFLSNEPKKFEKVNRLFGVGHLLKILKALPDPSDRSEAMQSIAYEADTWAQFPQTGCLGLIHFLEQQANLLAEELKNVKMQIDLCKMQQSRHPPVTNPVDNNGVDSAPVEVESQELSDGRADASTDGNFESEKRKPLS